MVEITVDYEGDLLCKATHGPSGTFLYTDAPADSFGKAQSFSPTDLVATALGSCILTVMGLKAEALGLDISGASATVEKDMAAAPRRIARLATTITVPHDIPAPAREALEAAAYTCPVHKSLAADVAMPISFAWGAAA